MKQFDATKTQLIHTADTSRTTLFEALLSIANAVCEEQAMQALEDAEQLAKVAYTFDQEQVAALVLETALRKAELFMEVGR